MRTLRLVACALALAGAGWGQGTFLCACGAEPQSVPPDRSLDSYANTPPDLRPFGMLKAPYHQYYTKLVEYNGAARECPTVKASEVDEVRIGFLGPLEDNPDSPLGRMMLSGAELAIDEANRGGGYCGKPFHLMVHNDRAVWGASSNEIVKMAYDERVWAMLGSISGDSTHIALRVTLKAEVPIVNSAATDPTIPETTIPWYLTTLQDDRVQSYTLARRIYSDLGVRRVALLRVYDRYGKFGTAKFKDAARRLGHPMINEQKYPADETDFRRYLNFINESNAEAIVIWGDAPKAALILKQMREMGMKQRVFGSFRVFGDELLQIAGEAADGLEFVYPYDPTRDDPSWLDFNRRFEKRFGKRPDAFASLAFDTLNILLRSICKAGLSRGAIRDALTATLNYKGVTGQMTFDPNCKNIVPMYLGAIRNGKAQFRRYGMENPYARTGDSGAAFNGPPPADLPERIGRIVLFGPQAGEIAAKLASPGTYSLLPIASEQPWGKASAALVKAIYEDRALAIVAVGHDPSHLAEQFATKAFVPVVALSADRKLTSTNIPWIFRLAPDTPLDDALRLVVEAARRAGPNRGTLRDALAAGGAFDSSGEPRMRAH